MAGGKSWHEVRGQRALNEVRIETYRRLMDAQTEIAEVLLQGGLVSEEQLDEALSASQADEPGAAAAEDGIYLSALARYVSVLGGHLELRAVFPDVTVTVRHSDAPIADGRPPDSGQISGSEAS